VGNGLNRKLNKEEPSAPEVPFWEVAIDLLQARFWPTSGWPTIPELEFIVTRALMGTDREHLEFPNMILIAHDSLEATAVPRQNIATSFGAGL
jgi:hypothetical protein